jgi:hypothetical protein
VMEQAAVADGDRLSILHVARIIFDQPSS